MTNCQKLALELLEKYASSEKTVIYEYSSSIKEDVADLEAEVNAYRTALGLTVKE